ncbi:MAG: hypothetical protein QGG40_00810, partial [Myxococcota bacterium]|nr:hypothetical protein [Myxococcota bacterium]
IESLTVGSQVLLGPRTAAQVAGIHELGSPRSFEFKGHPDPLEVFELPWNDEGPGEEEWVEVQLAAELRRLDGKQVGEMRESVRVSGVGTRTLQVRGEVRLDVLDHVQLQVDGLGDPLSARVTQERTNGTGDHEYTVVVTWAAPEDRAHLEALVRARGGEVGGQLPKSD